MGRPRAVAWVVCCVLGIGALAATSAFAVTPVAEYTFNGNFNPSSGSAPPLYVFHNDPGYGFVSEDAGGCTKPGYHFVPGTGLNFSGYSPPFPDEYTVFLQVRLDQTDGYRRLMGSDAPEPTSFASDSGIYVHDGTLGIYNAGSSTFAGGSVPTVAAGEVNEIAVETYPFADSKHQVDIFQNGSFVVGAVYSDGAGSPMVFGLGNVVTLFKDDTTPSNEEASGTIFDLQFFDSRVLESDLPRPTCPEPAATPPAAPTPTGLARKKCKKKKRHHARAAKKHRCRHKKK
jgi:hypothetical protein